MKRLQPEQATAATAWKGYRLKRFCRGLKESQHRLKRFCRGLKESQPEKPSA